MHLCLFVLTESKGVWLRPVSYGKIMQKPLSVKPTTFSHPPAQHAVPHAPGDLRIPLQVHLQQRSYRRLVRAHT